jgi:hypothetical protein
MLRLVIVAESPPVSGLYFYDPSGKVSEPLFSALMRQIGCSPSDKAEGLGELRRKGWLLVDATYQQVDKDKRRDETIVAEYPLLLGDLTRISPDKSVPVVLIKANVCRLLAPRLLADGFTVLNQGIDIYFPSHGNQPKFHQQFSATINAVD